MSRFDSEITTLEYLIDNKKPECATALEAGFRRAVSNGLGFREAYYAAELTHLMNDHDGANHAPELTIPATDEAVRDAIHEDAEKEDINALLDKWYTLFRSWNFGVALSFATAIIASQGEWEDTNDLDEAEGINLLNELPDEEIKDVALTTFYTSRNKGASVYASLRDAKDVAEEAHLRKLLGVLGGFGDGGSRLN